MADRKLRAVDADEKPAGRLVRSVADAVERRSAREQLVAMRTRIAKAIDEPNIRGADLAALSRRLLEIGREIAAVDTAAVEEAAESVVTDDEAFDASAV